MKADRDYDRVIAKHLGYYADQRYGVKPARWVIRLIHGLPQTKEHNSEVEAWAEFLDTHAYTSDMNAAVEVLYHLPPDIQAHVLKEATKQRLSANEVADLICICYMDHPSRKF